LCNTRSPTD